MTDVAWGVYRPDRVLTWLRIDAVPAPAADGAGRGRFPPGREMADLAPRRGGCPAAGSAAARRAGRAAYLVARIAPDGAVTYVNPAGAAMVDRRSEQIVGRPLTALGYPPPLAATWAAAIGRVTATGTPVPVDYEVVGAGGTRRMEGVFVAPSGTRPATSAASWPWPAT